MSIHGCPSCKCKQDNFSVLDEVRKIMDKKAKQAAAVKSSPALDSRQPRELADRVRKQRS